VGRLAGSNHGLNQWRNNRCPVNSIAMPRSFASSMTS
jgi:hypothetical protein